MEPDVAMLFKKSEVEDIDLGLIESNLRRAIEEVSIKCHTSITCKCHTQAYYIKR